jgi:iodotyrosine deiodinase
MPIKATRALLTPRSTAPRWRRVPHRSQFRFRGSGRCRRRRVAIGDPEIKRAIRLAAEEEERAFYEGRAGEEWLGALAHLGTDSEKPFLETAPWLIAIFAQRWGIDREGRKVKHYYVPESVSIAIGLLIASLHSAGLATLTHTPSPMGFLNQICGRPDNEKPLVLLVVGHPAEGARVPAISRKPEDEVLFWKTAP